MSSEEFLTSQKNHPVSTLQLISTEWDLILPGTIKDRIEFLKREFKFLDIFLSLQSLTSECSMEDVTQKVQAQFQNDAVNLTKIQICEYLDSVTSRVQNNIWLSKLEIRDNYPFLKMAFSSKKENSSSNAASPDFLEKFIDIVLRNLSDLLKIYAPTSLLFVPGPKKQMEEVVKELKLLRNFVFYVSNRCTKPQNLRTFFTHVLLVVGHAAMDAWLYFPGIDGNKDLASNEMDVLGFLQMRTCPIQPFVCDIYIDVLQALKSEQTGWDRNIQIEYTADCEVGFVETLIHYLSELPIIGMHKDTCSLKDQKAILQEMLNLLRANLISLPIKDHKCHLQDIDAAIIDAGLLVYSLYSSMKEKEDMAVEESNHVPMLDFSGIVQSIQTVTYLITRKSFLSLLPRIDGLGSIGIILDYLKEFLSHYSYSLSSIKAQLQTIKKELEHFQKQHDGFLYFPMQLIAKAYEVEHIVVSCINRNIPVWCLVRWIGDIVEETTLLMREAAEMHEKKVSDLALHNTIDVASVNTSQFARITSMREEMVGFQEVMDKLSRQLLRGSPELDVISIVGMAGLGKTTLANKLFLDQLVVSHFDVRAQCCVSQAYTRKDLLLTILRGVKKDTIISDKLPENELADKLRRLLLVQRYLILVDDVWETNAWDDLKPCFYDANNGSRIILTTRLSDVAFHAKLISDPHFLRLFTLEESWMLLKNRVFSKRSCPLVLEDVGQKIAQKCGGLPLSVVLIAGILETMEKEKHSWEQVASNLGPHIHAKSEDIIDLSYQNLPYHLKPCFLYFGVFLEDEEIKVSKLTWLWTAEGLVKPHAEKLPEDIAEYYLENLIGRNLVMVSKKSSDGKIKACRIHDLLLDYCRLKAKMENFLQWIKGKNIADPSSFARQKHKMSRRLCLYFEGDNLVEWSSICLAVQSFHLMKSRHIASSSIGCTSFTFNNFKFLRVLDMEFTIIDSFPEALTCLRYAAVRIAEDSSLSFSSNLWNLETLIVKGIGGRVSLPDTLWKMVKLRHLHIYSRAMFTKPNVQMFVESSPKMDVLRTLASAWFSCVEDADNILANTPNLQKLRCEVLRCDGFFPAFNNLTKLEVLKFSCGPAYTWSTELKLPPNLKKLTLSSGRIFSLNQVATLPRLAVLKLLQVITKSDVWEVTREQFPQIKFLKLQDPDISKWNVADDAFPCLEHLVLRKCQYLEEIPSSFADMATLKSIKVLECNDSLVESAKDIQETQVEEMQNSGFKLFIQK
ncbi:putative late blight resistance protein -like protein R1B-23-like [Capsicum annuum]|nr:putative late blight resistance protein homolog R1B-16 isoform X2 [Capsicum annuum]XP_016543176.2 putative late blight resistance protein homolog R1B-16 isoform X2 [Capsicum annuum]XP_016543177.2 putative late blight resistance protein homolog R1B-16 isoform X2 [Capsicum annuum]KAF3666147.1 putative late blight resistance protein -like protein R1B-23-like [Capsicum annuum]